MAVIYEEKLKKSLALSELLPVYILFGEDAYLKKSYTDKISRKIAEPDDIFNYCKFSCDCNLQEVYDAVMQLPFMADKKCIILDDYDFEKASRSDFDKLLELVSDVPDTAVLVLYFDSVETDHKKGTKFKKLIAAAEKSGGAAVLLNHRSISELSKMLCDAAKKRGLGLNSNTARYLIENVGEDINLLKNELEKLCFFVGQGEMNREHIDTVCVKTAEAGIYELSKNIISCNLAEALSVLDGLFFARIEPMVIFYTVSSAFVDMYRVYSVKHGGGSLKDVAEIYGYKNKEFLLERAAQNLRKFDTERLDLCIKALIKADLQLKSFGAEPRIVLEELTVRLVYIITKGEDLDKA